MRPIGNKRTQKQAEQFAGLMKAAAGRRCFYEYRKGSILRCKWFGCRWDTKEESRNTVTRIKRFCNKNQILYIETKYPGIAVYLEP